MALNSKYSIEERKVAEDLHRLHNLLRNLGKTLKNFEEKKHKELKELKAKHRTYRKIFKEKLQLLGDKYEGYRH